jgi:UDP-N-acetylglucosamine 2-epimerase (non-hydrolysing)
LAARDRGAEIWFSGQHVAELAITLDDLNLPAPSEWLIPVRGARNLSRPVDVPRWIILIMITVWRNRSRLKRRLRSDGTTPIVLVHGDTFTCPIGALVGRFLGVRVGHIEAGLRSGSLRHPFPEEFNRRVAARLVHLHFPPTAVEAANLRGRRAPVVTTGANTIIDTVRYALSRSRPTVLELPARYGLATLHRFELVTREDLYRSVLETLKEFSVKLPVVYFCGVPERARLARYGLLSLFDETYFRIEDKLSYVAFLPILAGASFVVTDSGGLQEETAHLGIPCAVFRNRTERHDGEGRSMLVTGLDVETLRMFLDAHDRYRMDGDAEPFHPSRVIVDTLIGGPTGQEDAFCRAVTTKMEAIEGRTLNKRSTS